MGWKHDLHWLGIIILRIPILHCSYSGGFVMSFIEGNELPIDHKDVPVALKRLIRFLKEAHPKKQYKILLYECSEGEIHLLQFEPGHETYAFCGEDACGFLGGGGAHNKTEITCEGCQNVIDVMETHICNNSCEQ